MPECIICTINQYIMVFNEGKCRKLSSGFIEQYCANHEQVSRKNAWKTEGIGAQFRLERPAQSPEHGIRIFDHARITGITPIVGNEVVFTVSVGDSSGIFKRDINTTDSDCDGHILHDRGLLFQDIAASSDGRVAFSVRNKNGEQNIAIGKVGSSQYREITEGDSIDRNPCWNQQNPDLLVFDSAPIASAGNGAVYVCPRSILRINLKNWDIETVIESDYYDYINPQIDKDGNIWCIRRPFKDNYKSISIRDILLIPFKIGRALFRAVEIFTMRNTGEPLITSGANPSKVRNVPKDLYYEGNLIKAERNTKINSKSGDTFPGFIPKSWELIQIDNNDEIKVFAKGVCSFTLLKNNGFIYSNGRYLIKSADGKSEKIAEAILPGKIVAF